jgi:hypothetical protein
MKKIVLWVVLVIVLFATSSTAQTLYVLGFPLHPPETQAEALSHAFIELALKASPGDRIRVFDPLTQRSIADTTVPKSIADRARLRLMAGELSRVPAFFKSNASDPPNADLRVHLPNFLDTVASITSPEFRETRVLVCGSLFFGDGTDARYDFGAGTYPSEGHILAARSSSPFGTADLRKLENTRLDILNLIPIPDDRDRYHIERFWAMYAAERGVQLTSCQTDAKLAVELLLKDTKAPHIDATIDRRDLRREIHRVSNPALRPNTWRVIACIDASASMEIAFEEVRRGLADFAARLYDAGAEIHLAIVPFREEPLEALPFTPVRSEGHDGGKSLHLIHQYLDSVIVRSAPADPDGAIRRAFTLAETDTVRATQTAILIIGDTGSETDPAPERVSRLFADLTAWQDADTGRSVYAVYLGTANNPRRGFFEDLAATGNHPVATTFQAVADGIVEKVAAWNEGIRPD